MQSMAGVSQVLSGTLPLFPDHQDTVSARLRLSAPPESATAIPLEVVMPKAAIFLVRRSTSNVPCVSTMLSTYASRRRNVRHGGLGEAIACAKGLTFTAGAGAFMSTVQALTLRPLNLQSLTNHVPTVRLECGSVLWCTG